MSGPSLFLTIMSYRLKSKAGQKTSFALLIPEGRSSVRTSPWQCEKRASPSTCCDSAKIAFSKRFITSLPGVLTEEIDKQRPTSKSKKIKEINDLQINFL